MNMISVRDFGAVGDGISLDTRAIQSAIDDLLAEVMGQDTLLATAFHPELTSDRRVQGYFLNMVSEARR